MLKLLVVLILLSSLTIASDEDKGYWSQKWNWVSNFLWGEDEQKTQEEALDPSSEVEICEEPIHIPEPSKLKQDYELDAYVNCMARGHKHQADYENKYKAVFKKIASSYQSVIKETFADLASSEIEAMITCVILKESAYWKAGLPVKTHKGAVNGLAQFNQATLSETLRMLRSPKPFSQKDFDEQMEYAKKNRPQDIDYIQNRQRNRLIAEKMQKVWNDVKPHGAPALNKMSMYYITDKNNYKVTLALAAVKMMQCQLQYDMAYGLKFKDGVDSLLACTGAYNLGTSGFYKKALKANKGIQNVDDWLYKIKNNQDLKNRNKTVEVHDYIVSMKRCSEGKRNFPFCNTHGSHCVKDGLQNTNSCTIHTETKCLKERCS